jgi:hypothetical protein
MTIELEYGKRFTYSAFREFTYLRSPLGRLIVVSQLTCEELDAARLNVLKAIQKRPKEQVQPRDLRLGSVYYKFNSMSRVYVPFVHRKAPDTSYSEPNTIGKAEQMLIRSNMLIPNNAFSQSPSTKHHYRRRRAYGAHDNDSLCGECPGIRWNNHAIRSTGFLRRGRIVL